MKGNIVVKLFLVFFMLGSFTRPSPTEVNEEYNIKAAFIYKFTDYISWDTPVFANDFVIGVIGPSPIIPALKNLAQTKTINGKKIVIRQFSAPEEIGTCHILFISQKATSPLYEILIYTSDKGTLTISEKSGYCSLGTQINFILTDNKLKFEANPKAIAAAGLTASSQLLKLAVIVN